MGRRMNDGDPKELYFNFLYNFGFADDKHLKLARYLHSRPYEWTLEMDENRMYDGLAMRREFKEYATGKRFNFRFDREEFGDDPDIYSELEGNACTMLEFFVGFAYRFVRDMVSEGVLEASDMVESMLENLDIFVLEDSVCDVDSLYGDDIDNALDIWVNRNYDYDGGDGGIFVVENPHRDLRNVEMWVQASWWYNYWYC